MSTRAVGPRVALALTLLAHCGHAPPRVAQRPVTPRAAAAPPAAAAARLPDEPLTDLVAVLRIGSIRGMLRSLDAAAGLRDAFATRTDQLRDELPVGVWSAIDRDGAAEVLFLADPDASDDDPLVVMAWTAGDLDAAGRALAESYRSLPAVEGVRFYERRVRSAERRRQDQDYCALTPAPRPDVARARVICARTVRAVERSVRFVCHPDRLELPPNRMLVQLNPRRVLEWIVSREAQREESGTAPPTPSPFVHAMGAVVRSAASGPMGVNLGGTIRALAAAQEIFAFGVADDQGAFVQFHYLFRANDAPLVRALISALAERGSVPREMVARLPPGATMYGAGVFELRPLGETLGQLEGWARGRLADLPLRRAERAGLDAALGLLARTDRVRLAFAAGRDWSVTIARPDTQSPAAWAAGVRALLEAWRRPEVRTALTGRADAPADAPSQPFAEVSPLTIAGLPRGAHAVRVREVVSGREEQVLFIPEPRDLLVLRGPDARGLWEQVRSGRGPDVDVSTVLGTETAYRAVIVPARLLAEQQSQFGSGAAAIERFVSLMPDHGQTPWTVASWIAREEHGPQFVLELSAGREAIENLATAARVRSQAP